MVVLLACAPAALRETTLLGLWLAVLDQRLAAMDQEMDKSLTQRRRSSIASLVGALPNLGRSSMRRKDSRMPRKDSRAPGRRNSLIGGLTSLMGGSSRRNTTMDAAAAAVAAAVDLETRTC